MTSETWPHSAEAPPGATAARGDIFAGAPAWFAIQVKRHNERRVVRHLTRHAIPTFSPSIEVVRRYRTRQITKLEPLFPSYLFVQMTPPSPNATNWSLVRWTPGVRRILGTGETPVGVPDEVIEAIQDRVRKLGFVRPGSPFTPGSWVRFRSGPLAGLRAVFDRPMSKTGRVRVLLELLGQPRGVAVNELDLESA